MYNVNAMQDLNDLSTKVLEIVRGEIGQQSFENWFSQARVGSVTEDFLTIEVPNNFFKDWLYDHYKELLEKTVFSLVGKKISVRFEIRQRGEDAIEQQRPILEAPIPKKQDFYLNPKYTFEAFVVGSSNRFAHAASLAVAQSPARAYNPLFIYGGVGLGKTHLIQAIGNYIYQTNKALKISYSSSENFTNELINSIQNRTTLKFRERYRNVDVLLIDDVHFIAGKESTQEEFFHTFNTLFDAHRQIVLTSDRSPKAIPGLEERLISRFEWGLVTDIQPPDLETRIAILRKKSERESVKISEEVTYFLAERIKSNIRELEGALIRLVAHSSLESKPVDIELAQKVLKDLFIEEEAVITVDKIQREVANFFNLSLSDMKRKLRSKKISYPRQIAMFLSRELTDLTLPEIGKNFGNRDHTTVLHAYEKIAEDTKKNQRLRNSINKLITKIKS